MYDCSYLDAFILHVETGLAVVSSMVIVLKPGKRVGDDGPRGFSTKSSCKTALRRASILPSWVYDWYTLVLLDMWTRVPLLGVAHEKVE